MVTRVYCRRCGLLIAEVVGFPSNYSFKQEYGNNCRVCGHWFGTEYRIKNYKEGVVNR